ncbi:MAG: signal peptidase I, partial [Thiovulaceae bacterium]|nr:signal peptidase I [Sulfurimonadaceae bacterium]
PTPHLPWIEWSPVPGTDLINDPASGHLIDGDKPQRGDIVVFRYPKEPKVHYIKRCVATPGDEIFVKDKDLFLHPHEGDDFIRQHYPIENISKIEGRLWVKNPYMIKHKGIWHDAKVSKASQTIPANTILYLNKKEQRRDFIRVQGNDILVYFGEDEQKIQKKYADHVMVDYYNKKWIKNPKDYPLTLTSLREMVSNRRFDNNIDFSLYDNLMNEEIFDFYSPLAPFEVEKDHYFMMGDNRDHSNDSRSWGSVHYGLVEGTPWFVYFSIADDYSIRWDRVGKSIADLEGMVK